MKKNKSWKGKEKPITLKSNLFFLPVNVHPISLSYHYVSPYLPTLPLPAPEKLIHSPFHFPTFLLSHLPSCFDNILKHVCKIGYQKRFEKTLFHHVVNNTCFESSNALRRAFVDLFPLNLMYGKKVTVIHVKSILWRCLFQHVTTFFIVKGMNNFHLYAVSYQALFSIYLSRRLV